MLTDQPSGGSAGHPETKGEKVRGMNASLAPETASGGLRERGPGRLHVTRRQIAFALILAVLAVVAAVLTINSVMAGAQTFQASVTSSKVYDLNFANNGQVTTIVVKPGQVVRAGQLLATQDDTQATDQLAAVEGVVTADEQALAQAQSPEVAPAQKEQDQLQISQAQTALSNAQDALSASEASGKAQMTSASTAVTAAQQLAATDQTRYEQACPAGPVPPNPSLSGQAALTAEAEFSHCQDLQLQLDQQQAAITQAEAQVPTVEAQAQANINQAQATVNSAQATVNLAQYQETLQSSPTNQAAIAQAQANLSQAQDELAVAKAAVQAARIIAPDSGTVAAVSGQVGEFVGPDGVHQYAGPSALPSASPSGFQLFPEPTAPPGGSASSNTGYEPLLEIVGGVQQVMAEVPETNVHELPVGHSATVTIAALDSTVTGHVTAVVLTPTRSSSVEYDVYITLDETVPGLLPGMSATVQS